MKNRFFCSRNRDGRLFRARSSSRRFTLPSFPLPSSFENLSRSKSNFALSSPEETGRGGKKEIETNARTSGKRRSEICSNGKWRYVAAYFKFSPRNFGFVSSLRVWIVFPHPLPSRFYSFPRRHLVPRNFAALSAKLAVYSREGNERNNETSSRDATEDPPIFRWNEWKKR